MRASAYPSFSTVQAKLLSDRAKLGQMVIERLQ